MNNFNLPKAGLGGKVIKLGAKAIRTGTKTAKTISKPAKKLAPIIDFQKAMGIAKPAKVVTTTARDAKAAAFAKKLDITRAVAKPKPKPTSTVTKAKEVVKKGGKTVASGVKSISDKVITGLLLGIGSGTGTYFASKALGKDAPKTKPKSKN
mgnify:CR=1 FL=1